jgi:hypothetical protein
VNRATIALYLARAALSTLPDANGHGVENVFALRDSTLTDLSERGVSRAVSVKVERGQKSATFVRRVLLVP